jgi:large subunit ribosomal protein L41
MQIFAFQLRAKLNQLPVPNQLLLREFSKYYGKALKKRKPLTTKHARKGFYKGNGCRSEGRHTSKGGYVMDRSRMLKLVIPDLVGFKLKPYVANVTPKHTYPTAKQQYKELVRAE